uniref:Uncharacterized protein n=1 Tax=Rhizophora mucronata TaxID=61149 RepID=A0A2P2IX53_RHIMU
MACLWYTESIQPTHTIHWLNRTAGYYGAIFPFYGLLDFALLIKPTCLWTQ